MPFLFLKGIIFDITSHVATLPEEMFVFIVGVGTCFKIQKDLSANKVVSVVVFIMFIMYLLFL